MIGASHGKRMVRATPHVDSSCRPCRRPSSPGRAYSPGVLFIASSSSPVRARPISATGQLAGDDIETQTAQCLANVRAILRAAGIPFLQDVLRCGVFLLDISEFQKMNAVYADVRRSSSARTTIQAAALPAPGLRVEDPLIRGPSIGTGAQCTVHRAGCGVAVWGAALFLLPL